MDLKPLIEGVLFYRAEPVQKSELAAFFDVSLEECERAITELRESYGGRGLTLVENDESVQLVTSPALSDTIEKLRREEMRRDIGKAGAETLAIVLYKNSPTRAEIDFIRGVNSTFILRNLMTRGLVERVPHPNDQRSFIYKPTTALLAHLGIEKREALPNYEEVMGELTRYENEFARDGGEEESPAEPHTP